ncbi:hypothetical protein FA10DRAFT_2997 [Acaromyces ingoldii]|uniref:t-SNARE coiled-coil homology domain-containing protein n=1 Tax=Acaromyces ingoldii TaxID=215250 RepID=A0A316YTG3_9BASI|nr:hypothetical protein FA10DRAFT_2997 [Acaromyces ingoldii]PWN92697.1 hypothetical protein FA10DRAFT_2997 [Acaromyces ingoldii]
MDDDDDDDDDGDDEEEDIDPRILARIRKVQAPAPVSAVTTSTEKEEEDEEMEAYEAASRARQKEKQATHASGPGKDDDDDDYGTKEKGSNQEEERPTALQSDRSLQDSLSGELLRMAGTLKANSLRFADALERDRKIVEEAGSKLEVNLTLMTRTRGKLGEYSKKARGMGWLTLGSVAVVCISWVIMFVVIKLT